MWEVHENDLLNEKWVEEEILKYNKDALTRALDLRDVIQIKIKWVDSKWADVVTAEEGGWNYESIAFYDTNAKLMHYLIENLLQIDSLIVTSRSDGNFYDIDLSDSWYARFVEYLNDMLESQGVLTPRHFLALEARLKQASKLASRFDIACKLLEKVRNSPDVGKPIRDLEYQLIQKRCSGILF